MRKQADIYSSEIRSQRLDHNALLDIKGILGEISTDTIAEIIETTVRDARITSGKRRHAERLIKAAFAMTSEYANDQPSPDDNEFVKELREILSNIEPATLGDIIEWSISRQKIRKNAREKARLLLSEAFELMKKHKKRGAQ